MNIQQHIETLNDLIAAMEQYIEDQQYTSFAQQQELFSSKMKQLLDRYNQEELLTVLGALKDIENKIAKIQVSATILQKELKDQSIAQQRAQKGIKAYK